MAGLILFGCSGGGANEKKDSGGPTFNSGNIAAGETFSYTFQNKGTEYYCTIHGSDMQGRIVVESGADSSGTAHVSMKNTSYNPSVLSVQPGTKVIWTNNDSFAHTVTSGNPSSGGGGGGY
ncbi:MAG: hypothetical protein ABEK84_04015 [Salinibacter sp.]